MAYGVKKELPRFSFLEPNFDITLYDQMAISIRQPHKKQNFYLINGSLHELCEKHPENMNRRGSVKIKTAHTTQNKS